MAPLAARWRGGGGDLAVAGLVAWLLVILGKRTVGRGTGIIAAALFLLLGNPAIQRLSGVRVRAQCETFIALAVVAALVLLSGRGRTRWHGLAAGCCFGLAFWLKYNAAVYALPIGVAVGMQPRASRLGQLLPIGIGFGIVSLGFLMYFAAAGALRDLWLATVVYNVQ